MVHFLEALGLGITLASVLVAAVPMPTPAPDINKAVAIEKRASCTFTDAAAASKSKNSCATIVLDGITVPSGKTLDMTKLTSGTYVRITTWLWMDISSRQKKKTVLANRFE